MYAQLGPIIFDSQFSFDTYKKETETKYAEVELLGGKPDLQRTGLSLDVISFTIKLHSSFCDPKEKYDEFERLRINGEILPFVDGSGNYIGDFVIEKITQEIKHASNTGYVIHADCEVTLREYVSPDRLAAKKAFAERNAFAVNLKAASTNINIIPSPPLAALMDSVKFVTLNSNAAVDSTKEALSKPSEASAILKRALDSVNKINASVQKTQAKISELESDVAAPVAFVNAIISIGSTATILGAAIASGDLSSLSHASLLLGGAVNVLNTASLPLSKLLILRK